MYVYLFINVLAIKRGVFANFKYFDYYRNIVFDMTNVIYMKLEAVAKALKELGHPTRLSLYKEVVRAGYQGLAVGNIQDILGIPASTLSHHVASLASAGLISQRREGRTLYCELRMNVLMLSLASYVMNVASMRFDTIMNPDSRLSIFYNQAVTLSMNL